MPLAFTEKEEIDKFIAESGIMVNFDHPNILRLVGVCFNMEDNLPAIVLPYMANGDLRSFLRARRAEMITSDADNERYPKVSTDCFCKRSAVVSPSMKATCQTQGL